MTVNLTLPDEIERTLRMRAAAAGQDAESFLRQIVADSLSQETETPDPGAISPIDFRARLDAWIALHPVLNHNVDDSRESIYEGRDK